MAKRLARRDALRCVVGEHFHHQVDAFRGSVRNQLRNADAFLLREVKVDVRSAVLLELGEHFEVGRAEHLRRGRSETF